MANGSELLENIRGGKKKTFAAAFGAQTLNDLHCVLPFWHLQCSPPTQVLPMSLGQKNNFNQLFF